MSCAAHSNEALVKWQPMNGKNVLKVEELHRWWWEGGLTHNFKKWFFDCPSERHYPCKSSSVYTGSCRRNWNIHWFMSGNFSLRFRVYLWNLCQVLDWRSDNSVCFNLQKSAMSEWWQNFSQKCYWWRWALGLCVWSWNNSAVITMEESQFTEPPKMHKCNWMWKQCWLSFWLLQQCSSWVHSTEPNS